MDALYTVTVGDPHGFRDALRTLVKEKFLNAESVLEDLLIWLDEEDVAAFCRANLNFRDEDNEPIIRDEDE